MTPPINIEVESIFILSSEFIQSEILSVNNMSVLNRTIRILINIIIGFVLI